MKISVLAIILVLMFACAFINNKRNNGGSVV